jgi:hypothetical protein
MSSTRLGWPRVGASSLTLGGLLKHLAITEDFIFTRKLTGSRSANHGNRCGTHRRLEFVRRR